MDPIEKAIRGALEKGNIEDKAFRERIYLSAEHALVRSLSAKQGMAPNEQAARVNHLRTVTARIETEFTPATAPHVHVQHRPAAPLPPRIPERGDQRVEPVVGPPRREPTAQRAAPLPAENPAETADDRRKRAKLFNRLVGLFVLVTLFALAVMLGWAVWNSGLMNTKERQDQAAQANSQGDGEDVRNWITVFQPDDISTVDVSDGLKAELVGEGSNASLRLVANKGVKDTQAVFEVGRGVLETLQGKKVVFDIRGHTNDAADAQIAITCDLAGMGTCQRTRFQLEGQTTDNLLIVQLADTGPEASGTLVLTPDLTGTGNPVDIQSIRVRIEP